MIQKIVVGLKSRLEAKYGADFPELEKLFEILIAHDALKGMETKVIYLDLAENEQLYGYAWPALFSAKDCKVAFDAVYKTTFPAYMVIFGAQDVFPFQLLKNTIYNAQDGDMDQEVESDLPYACESEYSEDWNRFTNPGRVVGRIPDLPGRANVQYVKTLIDAIVAAEPKPRQEYEKYFASSAKEWKMSTQESIKNIFSNELGLVLCPPVVSASLTISHLASLAHFYNCHGSKNTTAYYGQEGTSYPESLESAQLTGKDLTGVVAVAECCYGIQLLDPEIYKISVANNYLGNGALSVMGSSTIAYGPAEGQGLADLICQYYLIDILNGASCGRALLQARQQFITVSGTTLDPYELKTLAQFYIVGDPSLQLVAAATKTKQLESVANRRLNLSIQGFNLGFNTADTIRSADDEIENGVLREILEVHQFNDSQAMTFFVDGTFPSEVFFKSFNKALPGAGRRIKFKVYQQNRNEDKEPGPVIAIRTLVVKLFENEVLGYKLYLSK
jgi:hypothetical protein